MSKNLKLLESICRADTSCSNAGTINAANYTSKDMNNFFGYGNFNGKYWFIGQEENGDSEYMDSIRLKWNGIDEIMDICESNPNSEYLKPGARLVPTWRRLIRILLSYILYENENKELNIDNEIIREIQISCFGRKSSQICSLNRSPIPRPPRSARNIIENCNINSNISERIDKIVKIIKNKNKFIEFVIFYGWKDSDLIIEKFKSEKIEFNKDKKAEGKEFWWGTLNNSIIIICNHAAISTNKYFEEIGKFTRQKFSEVNKNL